MRTLVGTKETRVLVGKELCGKHRVSRGQLVLNSVWTMTPHGGGGRERLVL